MGSETKFLFENDFGDAELSESAAQVYTEDDMQAARLEAMQAARAELGSLEEKRAADLCAEMSTKLDTLSAQHAETLQASTEHAVDIAVVICQKILPTLAAQNALTEIEGHIARTLADVYGEPQVVVRVSEENVGKMQPGIDSLAGGFDGKIVLVADDQLSATDCHVMWADGGSERDVQRTWAEIDKAVEQISELGISSVSADPGIEIGQDTPTAAPDSSLDVNGLDKPVEAFD